MPRKLSAKTEMSSLDVRAAVRELRETLKGSRIDKAYEPGPGELLLRLRGGLRREGPAAQPREGPDGQAGAAPQRGSGGEPPKKMDLSILVGKAIHVTVLPRENPEKPTSFVMNLRKHLANGFVDEVRQHGFDRIVEIVSNRREGRYVIVAELFSDGNVVLVKDDRIVTPLRAESWAHRQVRPGVEWVPPPARADPATLSREEFRARVRGSNADAVRTLATEANLGGPFAEEVCAQAGVAKNAPVAELSDAQIDALADALRRILERVETGTLEPVVVLQNGEKVDVAPFPMSYHEGLELVRHATFQEALDAYFGKAVTVEKVDPRLKKLEEERTKVQRMLDAQRAAVGKFEKEEAEARRKGDLLYGHFDMAGRVTQALFDASKTIGWQLLQAKIKEGKAAGKPEALMVDQLDPHEGAAVLLLEDEHGKKMKVRVDLRKTVQENADALYEASKKYREKRKGAIEALERTEARMKELEARGVEIVAAKEAEEARKPPTKRFWFEQFRWFHTSDGHLVMAGRDVRSNEKLVSKQLEDNDRYLHADISGAPSVVVKAKEGKVSDAALEEAATFAACMSRVWNAGHASAEAYWVTPQQVSKTPNPGEFLAKGAFIIRGKRNFIRVPVRLAVGEVEIDGVRKIMGGPVAAVASRSQRYVVLEPGDTPTNQLANKLAKLFDVNVEEVQTVLPPAAVRVVEAHGLEL
ncbi:MAG TPA: ribosome rescue protein RqcH [Candidatus Thermoplasmatota archaeon]|nr:ribosome rescue protein RqcH [Candidatus Thermoplasmatota archaeon]